MTERMIRTAGVTLCTESFGDRSDPPILLVMGTGASMLWWEEGFCQKLAEGGRFVVRYDHREPDGEQSRQPLSSIAVPTLVIHGTADPMFPFGHGEALTEEIPTARLLPLEGAGHGVDRADWETIVHAVLAHTAADEQG